MADRIRGKVAELLTIRELVLNIGSANGVAEGMVFAVLNRKGAEITDPDSGAVIGSIELPKVLVKAARVHSNIAVARTFRAHTRNVGGAGFGDISRLFAPSRVVDVPETLRLSERTYVEELDEDQSYVKKGDPVVQVLGDEFDGFFD